LIVNLGLSEKLYDYMLSVSLREPEVLERLRHETDRHEKSALRIEPEQGQLMAFLAKLIGARRALEIGVYTGYSALWVALALPEDGELVACDIREEWAAIGEPYWEEAGVVEKIDLRIAPATETLKELLAEGEAGTFDLAFIDADKKQYDAYYEYCLDLVRPGGLIAIDNVLWHGHVLEETPQDEGTRTIQALNERIHQDQRVDMTLVPIRDGLTLVRKRES